MKIVFNVSKTNEDKELAMVVTQLVISKCIDAVGFKSKTQIWWDQKGKSVAIGLDDHRGPQPNNIDLFGGNDRRKINKSATAREEITFLYDKDGTYLQDWMNTIWKTESGKFCKTYLIAKTLPCPNSLFFRSVKE